MRSSAPPTLAKATAWRVAWRSLRIGVAARRTGSRSPQSIATVSSYGGANGASVCRSAPPIDRFSVVHATEPLPGRSIVARQGDGDAERLAPLRVAEPLGVGQEARPALVDRERAGEQHAAEGGVEGQPRRPGRQPRAVDVEHDRRTVGAEHDGDEVDVAGHHARELAGVWEKHAHSSGVGARRRAP